MERIRHTKIFIVAAIIALALLAAFLGWHLNSELNNPPHTVVESNRYPIAVRFADPLPFHSPVIPSKATADNGTRGNLALPPARPKAGEPVSVNLARAAAEAFLQAEKRRSVTVASNVVNLADFTINATETVTLDGSYPLAYVHSLRPSGFIITSANTGIRPIVGFSFKTSFSSQDSADNVLLHLLRADMKARAKALSNGVTEQSIQSNVMQWAQYEL